MKLIKLLLPAILILLCSQAIAGEFHVAPVSIDFENQQAQGNLIAARASENPHERIGCAVGSGAYSPFGDGRQYAYCEASLTDSPGFDALCVTDDAAMIDTIASINTFSFVFFQWEHGDSFNVCTHVTVATRSVHIPQKIELEMDLDSFD